MRRLLVVLLFALCAAPAHAAPRALALLPVNDDNQGSAIALAGDHVLYVRIEGRTLRVYSVPVTGGTPKVIFTRTGAAGETVFGSLAASAQRVGLIYSHGGEPVDQVFAGPPTGPLEPITEPITDYPFPLTVQVDGDRVFEARFTGTSFFAHLFVHDPAEREVPFDDLDQPNSAVIAGDLVAYRTPFEEWNQLVVRDWRTGAVRSTTDLGQPIQEIRLRPDGRTAVELNNGELRFDGHKVANQGFHPRFAGDRLVYFGRSGLHVRDADGRIRAFGTTTINPGEMVADAEHVAWIANDCLLVAPVTAARATVPGPGGPCPRSELQVLYNSPLKAARTLPVKLQCVAAPTRCRGTVRFAGYSATHRFDIASGHTGTVRLPLTHALKRHGPTEFMAEARTDDGERSEQLMTVRR